MIAVIKKIDGGKVRVVVYSVNGEEKVCFLKCDSLAQKKQCLADRNV